MVPIPTWLPPQLLVYQSITAPLTEAVNSDDSPSQMFGGLACAFDGSPGTSYTDTDPELPQSDQQPWLSLTR